jgi:hypothetical protein
MILKRLTKRCGQLHKNPCNDFKKFLNNRSHFQGSRVEAGLDGEPVHQH